MALPTHKPNLLEAVQANIAQKAELSRANTSPAMQVGGAMQHDGAVVAGSRGAERA